MSPWRLSYHKPWSQMKVGYLPSDWWKTSQAPVWQKLARSCVCESVQKQNHSRHSDWAQAACLLTQESCITTTTTELWLQSVYTDLDLWPRKSKISSSLKSKWTFASHCEGNLLVFFRYYCHKVVIISRDHCDLWQAKYLWIFINTTWCWGQMRWNIQQHPGNISSLGLWLSLAISM